MRFAINGRFLTRPTTGVERYAREIVAALDELLEPGEAVIVVPEGAELVEPPRLAHIEVVCHGRRSGHAWEQLDYSSFLRRNGALGVSLCNTAPMRNPGCVCIHDMAVRADADNFNAKFVAWYRALFFVLTHRAGAIITVSEFSRREIERYYPAARGRITVISNAWQHIERIEPDNDVFSQHPELEPGGYWFAMSSSAPNKNLRWLVETALANPGETIAIAGGLNTRVFGGHDVLESPNVVRLGRVSDEQAKALMQGCKGFLHPATYEGFGIPPMEAMACGAPVAVSDIEVMHEVYGASVHYVDPRVPCSDLEALFSGEVAPAADTLSKYSWRASAEKLTGLLREMG